MSCDGREQPARTEFSYVVNDTERGRVKVQVFDRINIDDVTLHLIERQIFLQAGGADPGIDLNQNFKDFLIRENYLEVI